MQVSSATTSLAQILSQAAGQRPGPAPHQPAGVPDPAAGTQRPQPAVLGGSHDGTPPRNLPRGSLLDITT